MVSSVEEDPVGVKPLVRKQRERDLDRPGSSVDEVSVEEKHVGRRRGSGQAEEVQQIVELTCSHDK